MFCLASTRLYIFLMCCQHSNIRKFLRRKVESLASLLKPEALAMLCTISTWPASARVRGTPFLQTDRGPWTHCPHHLASSPPVLGVTAHSNGSELIILSEVPNGKFPPHLCPKCLWRTTCLTCHPAHQVKYERKKERKKTNITFSWRRFCSTPIAKAITDSTIEVCLTLKTFHQFA